MTVEEIKRDLPAVKVLTANGEIKEGCVYGRNMKFAKVSVEDWGYFGFDVAWHTIQNCINNDRPIIL